jgi:hypothetical protein
LADSLVGAAVRGLGTGLLRFQGLEAAVLEVLQELVIALAAEAEFFRDGGDVVLEALPFQEHEEAVSLLVGGGDGQGARGTGELMGLRVELERTVHEGKIRDGEGSV